MSDLADILVKFRQLQDGLQAIGRREDVKSEALRRQIDEMDHRFSMLLSELERYLHADLMRDHERPSRSL